MRVVLFWMKLGREATKRRKALEAAAEAAAEAARALEASAKVLEAAAEAAKSKALAEQAAARTEQSEGRRLAVLEAVHRPPTSTAALPHRHPFDSLPCAPRPALRGVLNQT